MKITKIDQLELYHDIIHIISCTPKKLHERILNILYPQLSAFLKKITTNANPGYNLTAQELERIKTNTKSVEAADLSRNLLALIENE